MPVGILLFLLGLLAAGSGALKLRERTRARLGVSPLTVTELVLGAGMIAGSGLGLSRARPAAWTFVGVLLAVVIISAVRHIKEALKFRDRMAQSESDRLQWHLKTASLSGNGPAGREDGPTGSGRGR
jgi:hypothetical protein